MSETFTVLARDDVPDESAYDQEIGDGYGYVTMRDGVTLSIKVRLPGPVEDGPYPTVIEYSGYGPSNPDAGPEPGSQIAGLLGYATVGVNMRGTGCSGGVFDIFNPAQQADGYDVVETVARQPWVLHDKVGMVGLSYSGITQLYVAATRPPSLAAITPLSVIDDPWQQQWPGGIYNSGFTQQWLAERNAQSADGGTDWVTDRIDGGDTDLRGRTSPSGSQNIDFEAFTEALEHRPAERRRPRPVAAGAATSRCPCTSPGPGRTSRPGPRSAPMLDDFDGHRPASASPCSTAATPTATRRWC